MRQIDLRDLGKLLGVAVPSPAEAVIEVDGY
jgi:hypothetical protein